MSVGEIDSAQKAQLILAQNGKSFDFARSFLSRDHADKGARLYAFCRQLDDLADNATNIDQARFELHNVDRQLLGQTASQDWVQDFLNLAQETGMDINVPRDLLAGILSDLEEVRIQTKRQLIQYAYSVAGTVGLMMCDVFGVKTPDARPFAIDLGIAMQLTNIARDINEDAENDRRYIPGNWVQYCAPTEILHPTEDMKLQLQNAAARLLDLADLYYESARNGLAYLPKRPRLSILVASTVYREIGVQLRKNDYNSWQGRMFVSKGRKVALASKALWEFTTEPLLHQIPPPHNTALHCDLGHLDNIEAPTT